MSTKFTDRMLSSFRIAIGDWDSEDYINSDDILCKFLEKGVIQAGADLEHDYAFTNYEDENGNIIYEFETNIPKSVQELFVIKSHIIYLTSLPDISYDVGSHKVVRKDSNKIKELKSEYASLLDSILLPVIELGISKSEIDKYLEEDDFYYDYLEFYLDGVKDNGL